jgi:hypothetical protein
MRFLVFTDVHESEKAFERVKAKAAKADILLCCGDMTIFERQLETMMKKIASLGKETFIIHGNHESASRMRAECEKYKNLHFCHKRVFRRGDIAIIGYGGLGFSFQDKSAEQFFEKAKSHFGKLNILLTHQPPYGTKVDSIDGQHAGNKSFRKYLSLFQFVFCGHLHENAGKHDVIGKTFMLNAGPEGRIVEVKVGAKRSDRAGGKQQGIS